MADIDRPTAREVLNGFVEALHGAQEPLDDGLVLVPAVYEMLLHPDAYQALQPLLPRIMQQAVRRLDDEMERLNRRPAHRLTTWLRSLFIPLLRHFSAEAYLRRLTGGPVTYERVGERWFVDVGVTADPDAELDYMAVETDFNTQVAAIYGGSPTIGIRRRTLRLPDGRFETVISVPLGNTPGNPGGGAETSARRIGPTPTGRIAPTPVLARLTFQDNRGHHVYYMRKDDICIGRGEEGTPALDVALDTLPDVSRAHLRIRHDAATQQFFVTCVGRFGATIDGAELPVSVPSESSDDDVEIDVERSLPRRAEIGLADALFIKFEALDR